MQNKKGRKELLFATLLLLLFLSALVTVVYQPAAGTSPECEDYCYQWFLKRYAQGGPKSLNYCTDQMTQCLIDYCGGQLV